MQCPSCDTTIQDEQAVFCPRCGTALGTVEAEATAEIRAGGDTSEAASTTPSSRPRLPDIAASVGRSAASAGWVDAAIVAAFGFLTAVALGALLVLGAKFQYPSVGTGAGAGAGLEVIVMAGIAVLGAPIGVGDLTVSALPMGALLLVGWAIVWATRRRLRGAGPGDVRSAVVAGAKAGVPLAFICLVAALLFRIGEEPSPIAVHASAAFFVGALWGAVFGALGGWLVAVDIQTRVRELASSLADRSRVIYEGVVAGALMLVSTFMLAAAFALLWLVIVLVRGPDGFGWGEAFAALIYLAAFAPNIVISVITVALGAPVEVGAQVTVDGHVVGPLTDISLFSGDLGWIAFVLVLVPLVSAFVGGYSARKKSLLPKQGVAVLGVAALLYAFVLADLAVLADARLGAGLVRTRGFALVAPNPMFVFLLALAWAAVVGSLGWWYAERETSRPTSAADATPRMAGAP